MHSLVNAMFQYGLVTVPVGIATAAGRKSPEFRGLHDKCMAPLKKHNSCSECGEVIETAQVVKGYEFVKGQFIAIEADDLKRLALERSKVIAVKKFVPWDSVDEVSIEKSYYLTPNRTVAALAKPYGLLSKAMFEVEAAAIATCALWGKEYPAMIWPRKSGALIMSMLYCHDEVVADDEIVEALMQDGARPNTDEFMAAHEYVAMKLTSLNPQEDLRSRSRERVEQFLAAKTQGIDFDFMEPEKVDDVHFDLLDRLKLSIEGEKVTA